MRPSGSCLLLCLALTLCLGSDALAVSGGAQVQAARYDYAGYRLSKWKRDREAIVYYTAAIKADPKNFVAYFDRANCYEREHEWPKALSDCNTAIRLKPADADTYYLRACALYELGWDAEARADLERCEQGKPTSLAREGIADLRIRLCQASPNPAPNELRTSIKSLDRAVTDARTVESKAEALDNRAWFFAVSRASTGPNLTQALADVTEAVRLKRDANDLDTLAAVLAGQGDYPKAIETEKKALAMAWHDSRSKGYFQRHLAAFESHPPYSLTAADRG